MRAARRVGSRIGEKWTIVRLIGLGGSSAVYEAAHRNGYRAAVKVLHSDLLLHPKIMARFRREGYVANRIDHPGVPHVLDDIEESDGTLALVMELLEGETLDARWKRHGRKMPAHEVIVLSDRVLDVLRSAHANGIVHRDLKPRNIFICDDGKVKVLDFGIASYRDFAVDDPTTQSGIGMGTPAFMAREQARGLRDEIDRQTDLWALGATLFTVLSGEHVFEGRSTNEVLISAATQEPRPVRLLLPELSPSLVEVLDRALRVDKRDRWADADSMQRALRAAAADLGVDWGDETVLARPQAGPRSCDRALKRESKSSSNEQPLRSLPTRLAHATNARGRRRRSFTLQRYWGPRC